MAETYDEIIEEIKQIDYALSYCLKHKCTRGDTKGVGNDMALHFAARVRDAVGGDPNEWWVEDADGNRVHIGDDVKSYNCTLHVRGLGVGDGRQTVEYDNNEYDYANTVHKIIPETRERIVEDALTKLDPLGVCRQKTLLTNAIEETVDRAMKLGTEHK